MWASNCIYRKAYDGETWADEVSVNVMGQLPVSVLKGDEAVFIRECVQVYESIYTLLRYATIWRPDLALVCLMHCCLVK